jgi:hypothetical protein
MCLKVILIFIIAIAHKNVAVSEYFPDDTIVVNIDSGKIRGRFAENENDNTGFVFLAIPYAKPPVGELRFQVCVIKCLSHNKLLVINNCKIRYVHKTINTGAPTTRTVVKHPRCDSIWCKLHSIWSYGGATF